jgi:hypothetical protein
MLDLSISSKFEFSRVFSSLRAAKPSAIDRARSQTLALYDGLLLHDPSRKGLLTIWELGGSVNTTASVESNRAIAVSRSHVFIRLGPVFKVEDWKIGTYDQAGGVIFCL